MTRVDFYVLPDPAMEAARRFACRLAYIAVCANTRVYVLTDSEAESHDMDELMWTYPEHQFLPHAIAGTDSHGLAGGDVPASTEVLISHEAPNMDVRRAEALGAATTRKPGKATTQDETSQLLINLSPAIPTFFGRFERVAEIIVESSRTEGRDRYKHYRDRGYPLYHHELNDWEAA